MQNNFPKIPLFLAAVFFIFSGLFALFFYRTINGNIKESKLKEQEWQNEARKRDEIEALYRSMQIIEEEKTQLESHFAKSSNIVPFLNAIEGLAFLSGAQAKVVSVKDGAELLVEMKASGNFESLYKFLTLLENSSYELEFVEIDMNRETGPDAKSKNAAVPQWNLILKIRLVSFAL